MMKLYRKYLFIFLTSAVFSVVHVFAQSPFQKLIGSGYPGEAHSFCTSVEGYYVAAVAGSLVKIDTNGFVVWVKKYLAPNMYVHSFVIRQSNNGYMMVFDVMKAGIGLDDIMMFNTDSSGQIEWIRLLGTTGSDVPEDVKELSNGDFIICGQSNGFGQTGQDMLLMRISKNGDPLWQRTYGTASDDDLAEKMIVSANGNYYLGGTLSTHLSILKTNQNGELLWSNTYGFGKVQDMIQNPATGDLFVCGKTMPDNSKAGENMFVMKTDSSGNVIWAKINGDNTNATAYSISISDDYSTIYIAGEVHADSASDGEAIAMSLQASDGTINWSKAYGTGQQETFYDNMFIHDHTLVNLGYANTSDSTLRNIYIVQTPTSGISGCFENNYVPVLDSNLTLSATITPVVSDTGDITLITKCFPPSWISHSELTLCSNSIEESQQSQSLQVFPNPVRDVSVIELNAGDFSVCEIYDLSGKCCQSMTINKQSACIFIKRNDFCPGIYLVKLIRENASYTSIKIAVE
jgi:hypothetical protein